MKWKHTELRKHPRLPLSFPVFAHGINEGGKPYKELLTALNVSAGGMLAQSSLNFLPRYHLKIALPVGIASEEPQSTTRNIDVEVVRVERRARAQLLGLRFHRPIA